VSSTIGQLVKDSKDRIIVAAFSSNIYRVREILKIAQQNNRKIAIFG
jgi:mRNA degradation ribonuclease J1/J2